MNETLKNMSRELGIDEKTIAKIYKEGLLRGNSMEYKDVYELTEECNDLIFEVPKD